PSPRRYIDQILKGTKAGEIPIYLAVKFDLVVNMKAAKAIGLTIPPALLGQRPPFIDVGVVRAALGQKLRSQTTLSPPGPPSEAAAQAPNESKKSAVHGRIGSKITAALHRAGLSTKFPRWPPTLRPEGYDKRAQPQTGTAAPPAIAAD